MAITIHDMLDQLLTIDQLEARLGATEPLAQYTFPVSDSVAFTVPPTWKDPAVPDDEPCGAVLTTGAGEQFALSRNALLEAGASVGIPRRKQELWPESVLRDLLRWWFQGGAGNREFKLLARGTAPAGGAAADGESPEQLPLALALTRHTITPFSNLRLLEVALERIRARYGDTPVYADYKCQHGLEHSAFRLIIPEETRVIPGTRVDGDTWSAGLDVYNSLTGLRPTDISGYLFRYWCTNGSTDTLASTGAFSRRGSHDDADVWEWARSAVDQVLGGLEGSFAAVEALTQVPVAGDVNVVLADLFAQHRVPVREQSRIIAAMAELDGDLTMYDVHAAVTQAANEDGLSWQAVQLLLEMGGHVAHAATGRCGSCRRILPAGYHGPAMQGAAQGAGEILG